MPAYLDPDRDPGLPARRPGDADFWRKVSSASDPASIDSESMDEGPRYWTSRRCLGSLAPRKAYSLSSLGPGLKWMLGGEHSGGPGSVGGRNMESERQHPAGGQAAVAAAGEGEGGGGRELAASRAVTRRSSVDSMRSRRSWTSSKRWALEFVYVSALRANEWGRTQTCGMPHCRASAAPSTSTMFSSQCSFDRSVSPVRSVPMPPPPCPTLI